MNRIHVRKLICHESFFNGKHPCSVEAAYTFKCSYFSVQSEFQMTKLVEDRDRRLVKLKCEHALLQCRLHICFA